MEQLGSLLIFLGVGLLVGASLYHLWQRERNAASMAQLRAEGQVELARQGERLAAALEDVRRLDAEYAAAKSAGEALEAELGGMREKLGAAVSTVSGQVAQLSRLQRERDQLIAARESLLDERQRLTADCVGLRRELEAERSRAAEKLALLQSAEEQLSDRFKALAGEILEDKSRRFAEQNQTSLGQLLEPLKIRIAEFQGKVEEVYVQEGKDRSALAEQVRQLLALNNQLSKDAHNLTSALKGQAKAQGSWGELILERVLEASGLRRGLEYDTQESHTRADGTRAQPDVVVHLPEDRHLIVDAKMSLTAYEEYVSAEIEAQREAALKRHLESVRVHVRELSGKNYQLLYGLESLDFVLMFIPVEPAFMLAIAHDGELWQDAWRRNVLLVSPSTLLFVVRTVAHLWRQEQQSRNAQDIASRGAELYDKLVGFVGDLENVGERLEQAKKAYDGALNKFSSGRGNVIRQAEMLKELGVKPAKQLPQTLVESAQEEGRLPG